jgi:hypothetical protein
LLTGLVVLPALLAALAGVLHVLTGLLVLAALLLAALVLLTATAWPFAA